MTNEPTFEIVYADDDVEARYYAALGSVRVLDRDCGEGIATYVKVESAERAREIVEGRMAPRATGVTR